MISFNLGPQHPRNKNTKRCLNSYHELDRKIVTAHSDASGSNGSSHNNDEQNEQSFPQEYKFTSTCVERGSRWNLARLRGRRHPVFSSLNHTNPTSEASLWLPAKTQVFLMNRAADWDGNGITQYRFTF